MEPKDVVKNWLRLKNTLEYLGLWKKLYNPGFKGVEFAPFPLEFEGVRKQAKDHHIRRSGRICGCQRNIDYLTEWHQRPI